MTNKKSDDIRRPLPKRVARRMAEKWLDKNARPEEIEEYSKSIEEYIFKWLLLGGGGLSIYHTIFGRPAETPNPIAAAPLPPPTPVSPPLTPLQISCLDWPIDRVLPASIYRIRTGFLLVGPSLPTRSLYAYAAADGI